MALTWVCQLSVAELASLGRQAPSPGPSCSRCGEAMAFDGSYPRQVREGGVVHRSFVRRARCRQCEVGEALAPDFLVRRRRD